MSRLLDEIIDMDAASRAQWLRALPSEHRDLVPALRQGLLSQEGRAGGDDPAALLDRFRAAIDTRIRSGLQAGDLVGPYRRCGRSAPAAWPRCGWPSAPTERSGATWR